MKALLIGGEKDGEIMEVESADIPSLQFMVAPEIPIRRTENESLNRIDTKRLEYRKLVAIDGVVIYTCLDYEDGIRALAEAYTRRAKRLSEERIKELVVARFDYGSAALSELVKAVEQEVLNVNGLGEQK